MLEFDAVVQDGRGGGALVRLPPDAAEVFGTRARFPVRATCNGVEYRGSTMPTGDGMFSLGITKAVREKAGVAVGQVVHVVVARDTAERRIQVPDDLVAALEKAELTTAFDALALTHRREYVDWITGAAKAETRQRRIDKVIEVLMR